MSKAGTTERRVKCPSCEALFPKSQTVAFKKRYYCQTCYEKKNQPKEKTDWDQLYETILFYYREKPTPLMFKQLKDYREQYHYTDLGMMLTLKYLFDIKKVSLKEEAGLGLIPYTYQEAKAYYEKCYAIEQYAQVFEWRETLREVKLQPVAPLKSKTAFNFETIEWGEETDVTEETSITEIL